MGVNKFGFDEPKNQVHSVGIPDEDMIMRLSYLGDEMCNHARTITKGHDTGGYDDHTHNLRSSIGFAIFKDGKLVKDGGYKQIDTGSEGIDAAKAAIGRFTTDQKLVKATGWSLLIVAGMIYAHRVEDYGYNVLFLTGVELEKQIEELKKKLGL